MKVLYIDPFSSSSHVNFNRMHIEAIRKVTKDLHFVFKEGYHEDVGVEASDVCYAIPSSFVDRNKGGLMNRLYMCLVLWKIRLNVPLKQYDRIIIAAYEEISLFFAFYCVPLYLINHNNISSLGNSVKRFFFKAISMRNTHIVLEPYIKDYLMKLGIPKVEVVRHGLIPPYEPNGFQLDASFSHKRFLFSPSMQSVDTAFMERMVQDEALVKYLEEHDLYLVLRSKTLRSSSPNIKILSDYLSKEEYVAYFLKAAAILLIYPKSFKYRVSGVLLEAISCGKRILMSDTEVFRQYEEQFGSDAYFSTIDKLIEHMDTILGEENKDFRLSNVRRRLYMPDYSRILE